MLFPGGSLWVDVEVFEETALTSRSRDPAAYRAAIDLYAGDLLPEDRYEEWTEGRRENLRQLYLALLIELAGLYEERDEYAEAIECCAMQRPGSPPSRRRTCSLMRLHAYLAGPSEPWRNTSGSATLVKS